MSDTTTAMRTLHKNKERVAEIADAFARYGFASWVAAGVPEAIRGVAIRLSDPELLDMSEGERVRGICVDLGTTFINMAQLLSTRRDMVGDEIADALATLQAARQARRPPQAGRADRRGVSGPEGQGSRVGRGAQRRVFLPGPS
ncbi:MAG: hypothetical protein WCA29_09945 [Jiangellales bacterium]